MNMQDKQNKTWSDLSFRLQGSWPIHRCQCDPLGGLSRRRTTALRSDRPHPQLHAEEGSPPPSNTGAADAPAWTLDRARLWNAIDTMEPAKTLN